MNKKILYWAIVFIVIALGIGFYLIHSFNKTNLVINNALVGPKNATYIIEGQSVKLINGVSSIPATPGSASNVTTQYFGNEVTHDFDGDGRQDTAFILTQNTGGSGTFYYVVVALNKSSGYIGSQGFLLGDRIAPQTTEMGTGNIIVVNYADRKPNDGFSIAPSVGKSVWLLLDLKTMQLGVQTTPAPQPNISLIDGRQCYTYNHEATKDAPYTVNEFIDMTISGKTVTGTKRGTQSGPDMTNGYSGTLVGTLDKDTITAVFSYIVEGAPNKEKEIYKADKTGIDKMRYPLIEEKGILVPDTTKEPTIMLYARVGCTASN